MQNNKHCFLFANTTEDDLIKVKNFIVEKKIKKSCVLIETHSILYKKFDFDIPLYSTRDVVPISSEKDETIYRESSDFNRNIINKNPVFFNNINFISDLLNYISIPYEQIAILIKSIEILLEEHDAIFICISHESENYLFMRNYNFKANFDIIYLETPKEKIKKKIKKVSNDFFFSIAKKTSLIYNTLKYYSSKNINKKTLIEKIKNKIKNILNGFIFFIYKIILIIYNFFTKIILIVYNLLKKWFNFIFFKTNKVNIGEIIFFKTTSEPLYEQNFLPVCQKIKKMYPESVKFIKADYIQQDVFRNIKFNILNKKDNNKYISYVVCFVVTKKIKYDILKTIKKNLFFNKNCIYSLILKNYIDKKNILFFKVNYLINYILYFDYLFKTSKPSSLYKECTMTVFDQILSALGEKYKIPIIASIHASIVSTKRSFAIPPTDYITIIGNNQKKVLLENNFKSEQIISVGQPELDDAIELWPHNKSLDFIKDTYTEYNKNKKTILIATSVFDSKNEIIWVKDVCLFASQNENLQIVIKPHRGFEHYYEEIIHIKNVFVGSETYSIYPFIQIADLVLTDNSHAGKLAIFFNKKLSVVNISGEKFPFNIFNEENVANIFNSKDALISFIEEFLNNNNSYNPFLKNYDKYIEFNFTKADGKASERIIEFLMEFHNKNEKNN
jgi:hypothetical protein